MRTFLFLNNLILILALLQSSGNPAASVSAKSELEADPVEARAEPRRLAVYCPGSTVMATPSPVRESCST
jgi:hypothetical protein